ncbi:lymphocyte antigen 75-like [Syngnathus typhle]|uniref:lymphocyte antigen 75-like n=1 Tax=Syngnathus typhle TaxID=161592 RepID=UPI002A69E72E|nr:lymphocyte antigen 75-like [Syngnathus typhle]
MMAPLAARLTLVHLSVVVWMIYSCAAGVTRHKPCDTDRGWKSHGSKCYKKMDTTNGWLGARHDCLWEAGDLVSITSEEEEKFVKEQMGDKPFWIGLSNRVCNKDGCQDFRAGEKRLNWSDTGVTPTYTNWDSRQDGSSNDESCAYVNQGVHTGSQPGKWRHGSCGSSLAYMCERSPDDCPDGWPCSYKDLGYTYSRVETSYCDSGEFFYKDSCYHFEGRQVIWQEAEDLCKEEGGLLASVHSKVDGQFLAAHQRIAWYSWLGLKKNNGKFEWRDGSSTDDVPWADPKYSGDCTKLNNAGEVELDACTYSRPSICQKGKARDSLTSQESGSGSTDHEAGTCDTVNGWSPHGSNCYKKMSTTNGWLGARHDCLWEGGDLVSITSEDEEKFVKEQMGDKAFWIGVSNLVCDKDWCRFFEAGEKRLTWSDTGVTPTYANWASSQGGSPNDESCAYVNQGVHIYSQPGKWRHGSCGSSLAYMCKRSPGDCPEGWPCSYKDFGHTYSRVETSYCNSGEFLYKDSCYHFEGRNGTWQAAEDFCKKERGLLASVHSKVDGQFLADHQRIAWYSWLGLKKNNGKFEWRDGSSTDDIPWYHEKFLGVCTKLSRVGEVVIDSCTRGTRPSICQKGKARASLPPLPASASASDKSAKCGLWWENPANDFCYMINAMPTKTWKEARDECARRRGNLLAITDLQELNFIHGLPASGSSLWLDASDTNVEVGSKQSDESSPSSVLLAASDPGDPPGRRCNSLLHGKGSMEVVDCDKKSGYVCRRRGIQTCEMTKGWRGFGSNCYRKMKTTNGWLGARYDCVWEGGDLVSITSEDEQKFVMEQMGDKPFWIGLSNLDCAEVWCQFFKAGEKRLTWSDTALTPTYAKWTSSQDGSSDDESCTYVNQGVHVDSQPGKWRHGSCGSSLMYMCERPLDACPDGRLCSYKDYGNGYNRVETSYCDTGEFLYRDSCYHFEGLERTWEAAEKFCEEWHGGHLASVQSLVDGQFLAANAPYAGGVQSWVGLKNNKDNFEWSDATSTGNILWVPNGPKGRGGCSALSPTGQLEDWPCTESRPFICKKAKVQEFLLPPPAGWSAKCGWWVDRSSSSDFCYLIQHKPTKTWQKARDDCLRRGGDLLSIADSNEQAFAQGLYSSLSSAPSLWLGVNNKKDDSEWTDGSPLGYMLMDRDDPGDLSGASCLSLLTSNGRWKFDDCRKRRGYICKKRGIPAKPQQPLPALTHHEPTCDTVNGWSPHGSNCYKEMETPNGWLGARHDCLWEGGDLVSITSEDEEMFVMEQMGNKPFWIGLSNLNCNETWCQFFKAGEKSVTWSYTSVTPTYANWDPRQDQSFNDESCPYVNQGVHGDSQSGKWRRGSCGSSLVYMCERSSDDCPDGWPCSYKDLGYSYSRVETSFCDSNEFLYKDSCYHFEGTPKTWQAAEDFCKEEGGLLASVRSPVDRRFLAAHVQEGSQPWLGLKKTTALKFEWLDGSSTDNVTKNPTQNSDDCAKLNETGEIQLEGCTGLHPSICQKGKARASLPLLPASASASGKSAKCGWWRENPANDFCYLINAMPTKTWKEARDECARLRGNLLAITDSNEHTFVRGLLPSGSSLWLDASDIIVEVGSEQSDESSPSSFLLGASNPGDPSGRRCNSILSGKGGVEVGDCEKKRGYVCKRRVVQTCERTKGWRRFGSNCYKKMETTNGWLGARYDCVWEGGDLVSIISKDEQSFVKEQMGDKPFWIGRSNLKCDVAWCRFFEAGEKRLSLSDTGVTPTYANWDSRQDSSPNDESCAYVNQGVHVDSQPGKWRHGSCGSSLPYMCERPLDACPDGRLCSYKDYGIGRNRVETSYCNPGDFLYKDSCYHFEGMKRTWEAAERFCKEWNGHLASVHSLVDSQFLTAHAPYAGGVQSWVGLKKNKDNFEWSDATPTGNIAWVLNRPTGLGDCCALSPTGQIEDWPCTNNRPFICKKAKVQEIVLPPPAGWSAKCGWWPDRFSSDFCYLIQHRPTKTWKEARDDCLRRGGDLLSITNSHEQAFIQSLYTFLPSSPSLWLGVNNNITKDGSEWTDGSPFGYVLMDGDDPGDLSGASCLSLLTSNGRWKFDDCRKKRGYICKKRGNSPKPSKPHDGFKEILVCDNHSADLVCEDEGQKQGRISIQSAFYGRRSDNVCLVDSDSYDDEYCGVEGILPRYRKMCNGHQKCHIELLEDDSCPATSKYLEMVYSCEHKVCLDSLGIADGSLADSFFKASSSMEDATPEKARLNGESCWKPSKAPVGSWIQVNLGYKRKVTAIVTQGCDSDNTRSWDIQLEMKVSVDRRKWTKHPNGKFIGGGTHLLETPAFAQYVRILPLENRPEFGLRLDILGCAHDDAMTCARQFNSLHLTDSMTFYCPPGCAKDKHFVFGTLVYSKDSHICAAAIHAGVIQNDIGGDCIVMRAPKQQVYTGSAGNGIISRHLDGPLGMSYTFADGEPRCSAPDWEEFAGFCYKPFDDERNWADAQQVCRGFDAEMVSIRTEVEQAWVKNASNFETSDMWTGLNDLALPGMFVWSDRHKVTFTHWVAGEPNQRVGLGKHCVALLRQTGKWKLMSCAQVNSFMCKMPKMHFPITSSKPQVAQ